MTAAGAPARLCMRKRKGFNLQEASRVANGLPAVLVSRPSVFGNPFYIGGFHKVGRPGDRGDYAGWKMVTAGAGFADASFTYVCDAATAVALYEDFISTWGPPQGIETLIGKNLACYCLPCPRHAPRGKRFDEECADCSPCHADTLGRVANRLRCEAL